MVVCEACLNIAATVAMKVIRRISQTIRRINHSIHRINRNMRITIMQGRITGMADRMGVGSIWRRRRSMRCMRRGFGRSLVRGLPSR